jgi:hypothetical protein
MSHRGSSQSEIDAIYFNMKHHHPDWSDEKLREMTNQQLALNERRSQEPYEEDPGRPMALHNQRGWM